jgi:hypothetical protein
MSFQYSYAGCELKNMYVAHQMAWRNSSIGSLSIEGFIIKFFRILDIRKENIML